MSNDILIFTLSGLLAAGMATACGDDDGGGGGGGGGDDHVITEDIEADTTWTPGEPYVLSTHVFVRGATLTVEPGTVIQGENDSSLVITTSGRLVAEGTEAEPIVFTSAQAEGSRAAGDWGGVVLLGLAPINVEGGSESIEGFAAGTDGIQYGGDDASHDCGSLEYVRIEFAGFELSTDNELNALTVGGCGSGTHLDYIQTHMGADDGVEFFGGTAEIRHLVVTQPDDDGMDWDFGWQGSAQFVIVQQNGLVGDKGFEADNNENDNDAEPRSAPSIWNATLIGSDSDPGTAGKTQGGMMLRRGTAGDIHNTIVAYFTDLAIDVADDATVALAEGGDLSVSTSCFHDNANDEDMGFPAGFDVEEDVENDGGFDEAAFFDAETTNVWDDPMLGDPLALDAPDFLPASESPMLGAGDTPPSGFDGDATFIGAVGSVDWTAGWTAYPAD